MSETGGPADSTAQTAQTTQSPPQAAPRPPARGRLTRSTDDRVIAGVCGGLARYLGIDPVLVRIGVVVLAFAGGSGVLAYLLAWLIIPEDRSGRAVLEPGEYRQDRIGRVVGVVLVVVGLLSLASVTERHEALLVLALPVGLALLWQQRQDRGGHAEGPPAAPSAPVPPPDPGEGPPLSPPDRPDAASREPSALTRVTLSLLLVLVGVAALLDVTEALPVAWDVVAAIALVGVGLALVVGGWWGRSRGLIAVGVLLAAGLSVASVVEVPLTGGVGDRIVHPVEPGDLRPGYHLGMGELTVDLSGASLGPGTTRVGAGVGAGELTVIVPADVPVVVEGRVGAGELDLFGHTNEGVHVRNTTRSAPPVAGGELDGADDALLRLRVDVGVGRAEVRRAPA